MMNIIKTDEVRKDNPHFGPEIRIVEDVHEVNESEFGFTHEIIFGALNSEFKNKRGEKKDAWAVYRYHPKKDKWFLTMN